MPFRVTCPGCRSAYTIRDEMLGQKLRCKKCQRVFQVTGPEPRATPPAVVVPIEDDLPVLLPVDEATSPDDFSVGSVPPSSPAGQALQTRPNPRSAPRQRGVDTPRSPERRQAGPVPRRARYDNVRKPSAVWWIVGAAAVLLIGGGVGLAFLLRDKEEDAGPRTALHTDTDKELDGGKWPEADRKPGVKPDDRVRPGGDVKIPADQRQPGDQRRRNDVRPPAPPPRDNRGGGAFKLPPVPAPLPIKPPGLTTAKVTKSLPAAARDAVLGGGGRYLVLHLPRLRKLAIFDVNNLEINYVPVGGDNVLFAAGMRKLMVVLPDKKLIQRWDLATRKREFATTLQVDMPVSAVAMGSASAGPLLLSTANGVIRAELAFYDIQTLKPLPIRKTGSGHIHINKGVFVRASADGRIFGIWRAHTSPQGLQTLVVNGNEARGYYEGGSAGHIIPGPDGRYIYTARGIYTAEVKPVGNAGRRRGLYTLPAAHGNFYLSVDLGGRPGLPVQRGGDGKGKLGVHLAGDTRPLIILDDIELPTGINQWDREEFSIDRRIHFIPSAKLIITIPESNDKLVLHRFDLQEVMDKAGIDYLYVSSRPPAKARKGGWFSYQVSVRSKRGGVRYKLDAGPPGMSVTPRGKLTWAVPKDFAEAEVDVILSVSDASGQEIFHTFKLKVVAKGGAPGGP